MQTFNYAQEWIARLDRRSYALLIGIAIGVIGAGVGLLVALVEPLIAAGLIAGALAGLYVITNLNIALYSIVAIMLMLPFGAFPFRFVFTPTLLDAAIAAFVLLYLLQWMRRQRRTFLSTPAHFFILIYMGWLVLTFVLGLRWAPFTSTTLRGFAETLLSIGLVFILVDLLRDPHTLRRLVVVLLLFAGLQAVTAIGLYALPDDLAEAALVRLSRIGYPDGGVIRYIEDNRELAERAIGTWVDPNALGGVLAITAVIATPQLFAARPIFRSRWLTAVLSGALVLALFLTYSRASLLAFAAGTLVIGIMRYRKMIILLIATGLIVLVLPQTQPLVGRFIDAFTVQDLATQMRVGEYTDSLRLITRYPIFGVGFTGTPDIDLYTDVASMYLIMANQIGITGVVIFAAAVISICLYGLSIWPVARTEQQLDAVFLGCYAALIAALVNAAADLYFFRLDFHASITLFWLTVALALASARLTRESTVAQRQ